MDTTNPSLPAPQPNEADIDPAFEALAAADPADAPDLAERMADDLAAELDPPGEDRP